MREKKSVYVLEFKFSNGESKRIQIEKVLSVGSDPLNDTRIEDECVAPRHCTFRLQNGVLSVVNHAENGRTKMGKISLNQGKQYLVGQGDVINLGDRLKIIVRVDKVHPEKDDKREETTGVRVKKPGPREQPPAKEAVMESRMFYERIDRPGLLGRFYAFLFEVLIVGAIYLVAIVPLELSTYFSVPLELLDRLTKDTPVMGLINEAVVAIFCLFVVFNTVSSLLFSSTLGLALMGARTDGNFFKARIKACVRFFLGLATGPFIIFDLPALFGWPTLKDGLTFSKFNYQNNYGKFIGLVALPTISIFILFIPTITYYNTLSKLSYTKGALPRSPVPGKINYEAKMPFHQINIRAELKEQERLLPYFEYEEDFVYPSIMFMDLEKKTSLSYGPAKPINMVELGIERIAKNDPFFSKNFPRLHKYYVGKENNREGVETLVEELSFFYQAVFSLNFQRLPHFVTTISPVIGPYLEIKKGILMEMAGVLSGQMSEFTIGSISFFEYSHARGNTHKILHPSVVPGEGIIWDVAFENEARSLYGRFLSDFIKKAEPIQNGINRDTPQREFTTPGLVSFLYRIRSHEYREKDYKKMTEFFKRKAEDTSHPYYAEALESALLSFQNSYGKIKRFPLEQEEALKNVAHSINELFDHSRTPGGE